MFGCLRLYQHEQLWLAQRVWGNQPHLLLLHGFIANSAWWTWLVQSMGVSAIANDFSGMGWSGWRDEYGLDVHVQEALSAINNDLIIVGHSYGGLCAYLAAQKSDKVKGVVMIDPPTAVWMRGYEGTRKFVRRHHRTLKDLSEVYDSFRLVPAQPAPEDSIMKPLARHSVRRVAGGYQWHFDPNINNFLTVADKNIFHDPCPVPLLYICAEKSPKYLQEGYDALRLANPHMARANVDAYHGLLVEKPDVCGQLIRRWVEENQLGSL